MREIKFRVWNLYREEMVYNPYLFQEWKPHHGMQELGPSYVYYEDWSDCEDGINRPCHVMQFTGLHDKNGIELFDGDIIDCHGDPVSVFFNQAMACWEIQWIGGDSEPLVGPNGWNQEHGEGYVIIGNIYANPELLK